MAATNSDILQAAIAAHGGLPLWSRVQVLELRARALFPLLMTKGIAPVWRHYAARIDTCRPRALFADYPSAGWHGEFNRWRVRITAPDGTLRERDYAPPQGQHRPRFRWLWDDLDMLFFLGYALWNYKVTPFWFARPEFHCEPLPPLKWRGRWLHRLDVTYPQDLPKHHAVQRYYIDEDALIVRLDYRADVIGRWAKGAHLCLDHRSCDGIVYPSRRAVYGGWIDRLVPPFPPAVLVHFEQITPLFGPAAGEQE